MKSIKEYIISEASARNQKAINFVNNYFDKFYNDSKNFMKNKFDSSLYQFDLSVSAVFSAFYDKNGDDCETLMMSLKNKRINGKLMPDNWNTLIIPTSQVFHDFSIIEKNFAMYMVDDNRHVADPDILRQDALHSYRFITNLVNRNLDKILEDAAFIELDKFTNSGDFVYEDSKNNITMKVFLWNNWWPIIRFDIVNNVKESLKIGSHTKITKSSDFIICFPKEFAKLNSK